MRTVLRRWPSMRSAGSDRRCATPQCDAACPASTWDVGIPRKKVCSSRSVMHGETWPSNGVRKRSLLSNGKLPMATRLLTDIN